MANLEIISVHIPKTAGTSLRNMILQFYGNEKVCTHYPDSPEVDGTRDINEDTKVVHGHFFIREYLQRYPEIKTSNVKKVAWLRHPITRLMSHYFYNKKYPFSINQDMNKLNLVDYAQLPWKQNEMSKHLAGVELEDYYFIGIQEFFNEDLEDMQTLLGWSNIETNIYDNSSLSNQYYQLIKETLSEAKVLDKIATLNAEDMELYEKALQIRAKRRQESSQIYQVQIGWQWAQAQLEYMESKLEIAKLNSGTNLFLQASSHLDDAAFITRVYVTYLKREPDEQGRDSYLQQINQGTLTRATFLEIIANSEESKIVQISLDTSITEPEINEIEVFLQNNSDIDSGTFITEVYINYLQRKPDNEGQANYLMLLNQNLLTRRELIEIIVNSDEYRSLQMQKNKS